MASDSHLDPNQLSALCGGELSPPEHRRMLRHLSQCNDCRQWVAFAQTAHAAAGTHPAPVLTPAFAPLTRPRRTEPRRWIPVAVAAALTLVAAGLWLDPHLARPVYAPAQVAALGPSNAPAGLAALPPSAPLRTQPGAGRFARFTTRTADLSPAPPALLSARPAARPARANPDFVVPETAPVASQIAANAPPAPLSPPRQPEGEFQPSIDFTPLTTGFQDQPVMRVIHAQQAGWTVPQSAPNASVPTISTAALSTSYPAASSPFADSFAASGPDRLSGPYAPTSPTGLGWAISRGGAVLRSVEVGTWAVVPLVPGIHVRSLFASGSNVWAGGGADQLYVSHDRGSHWRRVRLPESHPGAAEVVDIQFTGPRRGAVTLDNGHVWLTTDGGATWRLRP